MTFDRATGLEEYQRQQARKFNHLPDVVHQIQKTSTSWSEFSLGSGGGAATIIVAASNSLRPDRADFQCSGTGDDQVLQTAFDTLPSGGGRVLFMEGLYSIDNQLLINQAKVALQGQGWNTIIRATSAMTSMLKQSNVSYDSTYLADMQFDGNDLATYLVQMLSAYTYLDRCEFQQAVSHGVAMGSSNQEGMILYDSYVHDNGGNGVDFFMDGYSRIVSNLIAANTGHGIETANNFGDDGLIAINVIVGNTGWGVFHGQGNIFTTGNVLDDNTAGGINGGLAAQSHNFINGVMVAGDHSDSPDGDSESLSDPGTAVKAGTYRLYFKEAATITNVSAALDTAPTGSTYIVDVHKNGSTIFPTQANRPTIGIGAFQDDATLETVAVAAGDYLTVDIDQVGSTVTGEFLTVTINWDIP